MTIIAIALSALIGYCIYISAEHNANCELITIGTTLCLIATAIPGMGLRYESARIGVNIRVLSTVFFILFGIINILYARADASDSSFIITNGLILIIYLAILHKLTTLKQI